MKDVKTIGEVFQRSGMSQAELARRLVAAGFKTDSSYIGKLVRGEITPAIDVGLAIAKELTVPAQRITWGNRARKEETANR